ncbi:MAG: elongation factor P maturation arginine rhamnosyltransferase EarP [Sulfuriferula sp.]|nr:elongation factor P maturation arginine rhamnosyltransferase EarP [Sulfuriferula sp.]
MPRWDIFCRVIDNYGDIAVTWRLARQLVAEHGLNVRLWVDDLRPLAALYPHTNIHIATQILAGVEIQQWTADFPHTTTPADVVIAAFACDIPDSYLHAMANCAIKPRWLNLEYLSAEDWVAGCHNLPSPHPRLALVQHFFFPGFTAQTGGLIREHDLISRRDAFQHSTDQQAEFWAQLGITPPNNAHIISLFGYENPTLPALLAQWVNSTTPIVVLLPANKLTPQVSAFFHDDKWQRGNLSVHQLPFLAQDDYDKLLWLCDTNFVRGEDSFVRAIWAGKPFIWHIYPQADNAHHAKLNAFLAYYQHGLAPDHAAQLSAFWQSWNQISPHDANWQALHSIYHQRQQHASQQAQRLIQQTDLATKLTHS